MKLYAWAIALSLAGCTTESGGCPTETGAPYSLRTAPGAGRLEGFVLNCREVIEYPYHDDEESPEVEEVRARTDFGVVYNGFVAMGINGPNDGQPFCLKGEDFDSVEDIPSDISDCDWDLANLGGVSEGSSEKVQLGYIVRDRTQRRFWRLRVVEKNIHGDDSSYYYETVFEVAEFGE